MRIFLIAGLLLAVGAAPAMAQPPPSTLSLKSSPRIEAAPQHGGRFTLKARIAREEKAGELRQGDQFTLIGRIGLLGESCDFSVLFSNGFEGS